MNIIRQIWNLPMWKSCKFHWEWWLGHFLYKLLIRYFVYKEKVYYENQKVNLLYIQDMISVRGKQKECYREPTLNLWVIVMNVDTTNVPTFLFIADVTRAFSISDCWEWLALGVWLPWWRIDWEKPRLTNRSCWQMFDYVAGS